MAEGGYDPTTENETPWEDHGIDHNDDEEYTTPRSSPMKPPPPPPEEIEMSQLSREQNGWRRQQAAWVALKKMYPQANKDALEVSYVKMPGEITPRLSIKTIGLLEPIGCSKKTFLDDGRKTQIFLKRLKPILESQSKNK